MKYFLDTEFIEDGKTIDLISIGIVAEDGREFYAESTEADLSKASPWVQENVLPHLWSRQADKSSANAWYRDGGKGGLLSRRAIASEVVRFVKSPWMDRLQSLNAEGIRSFTPTEKIEFWGYYAASDWVAFYQLWGRLMDLPKGFPMYCRDVKQFCDFVGNPKLPEQGKGEHNALADARWNKAAWEYLIGSEL